MTINTTRKTTIRQPQGTVSLRSKSHTEIEQASFYFVGIGGCGMSGLAAVLARRGHHVSGSDMKASAVTSRLSEQGIQVYYQHREEQLPPHLDYLVISAAVKEDNPELVAARRHGAKILKYAEMLGQLSHTVPTYAVAGTHGKSTTSGWLTYVLTYAELDPSFVIGAEINQLGTGSGAGEGNLLVVEACEYDRSFLNLAPAAAAILNIEGDHFDYYRDLAEIENAFREFTRCCQPDALLVGCGEDNWVRAMLLANSSRRHELYAIESGDKIAWWTEELTFEQGCGCFNLMYHNRNLGRVNLSLAGRHNVSNALAAAALVHDAGVPDDVLVEALGKYTGVGRRMTCKGTVGGVVVLDDYAHHPTEIRVTLEAIRQQYNPKHLWCVFQPHQHSRTRFLLDEFALSFHEADTVLLPDIYFVRDSESLRRTVSAGELAEKIIANRGKAHYLKHFEAIVAYLKRYVQPGDVVVTMGAGDIWKLGDDFIQGYQCGN